MNQKKRKMNIRLALSLLALLTVFWACRKNYSNPLDSDLAGVQKGLSLKEAQAFHRSVSANLGRADRQVMGTDAVTPAFSGEAVVRWSKSDSYKDGRFEMLEVPIWFPKTRLTAYSFDGNKTTVVSDQAMLAASFSKYVIYRDPLKNKVTARILTFMPDKAYLKKYGRYAIKNTGRHLEKNFSGYIEVRNMKQRSLMVLRIKAGKVVKTVRMQRRTIGPKDRQDEGKTTMSACPQICDPEYEMDCHQGAPDPDASSGYETECTRVQVGVSCYPDPSCSPDPWEWPEPGDCDDPANYYLPQCGYEPNPCEDWGECGGEETETPPAAVVELKKDSLQKHFPCMVKAVLDKLEQNSAYNKLIQPFQAIRLPDGSAISLPGLPNLTYDFSSQPYGGSGSFYSLGSTEGVDGSAMSSVIKFNSSAMSNASTLLLQSAAIHEAAHAYARFYYKSAYYGLPLSSEFYSTWAMNMARFDALVSGQIQSDNFNDHVVFLEDYIDKFVSILKDMNGNTYTDSEYQMAALYGLNNAGSAPIDPAGQAAFAVYQGKLNQSYNNILSKYGLTSAQVNSFNSNNLIGVPAAQKLPTNCP